MKRIISTLLTLALASVAFFGGFSYINAEYLPDSVYVFEGEDFSCAKGLLTIRSNEKTVSEASATAGGSYSGKLCLFDVIPLKTVRVSTIERQSLVPSGRAFGVKLFTDGVVVVGFGDVTTAKKTCCPAKDSGIMLGDVIKTIDGRKISGNAELSSIVTASGADAGPALSPVAVTHAWCGPGSSGPAVTVNVPSGRTGWLSQIVPST